MTSLATSDQSERLSASLLQALTLSGYVKPGSDAAVEDRVRRMVRRLRLTNEDADIMQQLHAAVRTLRFTPADVKRVEWGEISFRWEVAATP